MALHDNNETNTTEMNGQNDAPEKERYTLTQFMFDAADLLESVIGSIFVMLLVFAFLFCTADVDGPSMEPTLENEDRLVVSRFDHHYQNGDILIFYSGEPTVYDASGALTTGSGVPLNKNLVKRLIATAGQEVYIDFEADTVSVDGVVLDEPYVETRNVDREAFQYPVTVPEGYVFVMGDHRDVSVDSRHPSVGFVPLENIVGKVVLRISPLSSFGRVE